MERVAYFRRKAEQCFRLARTLGEEEDRRKLEDLGREFLAEAEKAPSERARA